MVPRHSACEELWAGAATMLEPTLMLVTERLLTEAHLVSPDEVARGLNHLYADPDALGDTARRSRDVAIRPEYDWSTIAERWAEVFDELLGAA